LDESKNTELILFNQLKQKLRLTVETKLEIRKDFKDWSGSDIQTFQIDLEQTCKSSVSEKWVYSHFKKESEKLPRVDVLNLLSSYCGYKNWDDFKFQNSIKSEVESTTKKKRKILFTLPLVTVFAVAIWVFYPQKTQVLLLEDAYTHASINPQKLKMQFGSNKSQVNGDFITLKKITNDTIFVDGAYYKPKKIWLGAQAENDTIVIEMLPDDYALMLNYFSRSTLDDWEKRRKQLDDAIHDDAQIFQMHAEFDGLEMLNKDEFIDRLILPVNSLKNLEIQNIIYKDGKIHRLRFVQKIGENEDK